MLQVVIISQLNRTLAEYLAQNGTCITFFITLTSIISQIHFYHKSFMANNYAGNNSRNYPNAFLNNYVKWNSDVLSSHCHTQSQIKSGLF